VTKNLTTIQGLYVAFSLAIKQPDQDADIWYTRLQNVSWGGLRLSLLDTPTTILAYYTSPGTSIRDMHKAFHIPYVYDYITKSCRQQAEVIQNHENAIVRYIGQGEARHRKWLKLGGGHVYDCSSA
jgi:hypothetical protein